MNIYKHIILGSISAVVLTWSAAFVAYPIAEYLNQQAEIKHTCTNNPFADLIPMCKGVTK